MKILIEDPRYPDRVAHATGYGEIHRQLVVALDALGADVGFPPCQQAVESSRALDERLREVLLRIGRRGRSDDDDTVLLQPASPDGFRPRPDRFCVGLTMCEREELGSYVPPIAWAPLCNTMDLIVVPTEWNRRIFEGHGIHRVSVCPLGVDDTSFVPRPFRFLSVLAGYGYPASRANWHDIVSSFVEEFRGQSDVELTILSSELRAPFDYTGVKDAVRNLLPDLLDESRRLSLERPRVVVREGGGLSREAMRTLYAEHDCYISYSREGWGFPLLEAMACSLDAIASDYGAPMGYLHGSPVRLFKGGRPNSLNTQLEGGDLPTLRRHMREVYEYRNRLRRWASRWTWNRAADRLLTLLRRGLSAWRGRA